MWSFGFPIFAEITSSGYSRLALNLQRIN